MIDMNLKRLLSILICLGIAFLSIPGCNSVKVQNQSYWPTQAWRESTPEKQGMDSGPLARMLGYINDHGLPIHSVLVVRNGYLVVDSYFYPYQKGMVHAVHSATKSFTSTLFGIAIDQGYVDGENQRVLEIFNKRKFKNPSTNKNAMTVKHLLAMTAGLDWPQFAAPRGHPDNIVDQMMQSDDWVQFILDCDMSGKPGRRFNYCNGCSHLLSAIVEKSTVGGTKEFAEENLFRPLGITEVIWKSDPTGIVDGGDGLYLRPQDMAKFGYLYLNDGMWQRKQVVSRAWVAASVKKQTGWNVNTDYGYQWWIRPALEGYEALGYGGQHIVVVPEWDMVVVVTAAGMSRDTLTNLFTRFIKPSVKSSKALPANPDGMEFLRSQVEKAALVAEPSAIKSPPAMASRISGRDFIFEDNLFNWQSFSLEFQENKAVLVLKAGGSNYTWPIGFGGVFCVSRVKEYRLPFYYPADGIFALKGSWRNDTTFLVELRLVNEGLSLEVSFIFGENSVDVKMKNMIDGRVERFKGTIQD
jgi:CubicO group peptidase (beta-lactamase class C family)